MSYNKVTVIMVTYNRSSIIRDSICYRSTADLADSALNETAPLVFGLGGNLKRR